MYSVYFIVSKKEYSGRIRLYYPLEEHQLQYLGTETNPLLAMRKISAIRAQIVVFDSQASALSYDQFMSFLENNKIFCAVIVLTSDAAANQSLSMPAPAAWLDIHELTPENISHAFAEAIDRISSIDQAPNEAVFIPKLPDAFLKACLASDNRTVSVSGSTTFFPKNLWRQWYFYLISAESAFTSDLVQRFGLHCIKTFHCPFYINRITEHDLLLISGQALHTLTKETLSVLFSALPFNLLRSSCSKLDHIPAELCRLVQCSSRCRYFCLRNIDVKIDFFANRSAQIDFSAAEQLTENLLTVILTRDSQGVEATMNVLFSDLITMTLNLDYADAVYALLFRIGVLLNCITDSKTELSLYQRGASLKTDQQRMTAAFKACTTKQSTRLQAMNDVTLKALFYASMHYHEPHKLSDAADAAGVTTSYLCTVLKSTTDTTYNKLLTELRLTHACYLLVNRTELSVSAVAHTVGFEDSNYFSKVFRHNMGVTPLHYQKEGN